MGIPVRYEIQKNLRPWETHYWLAQANFANLIHYLSRAMKEPTSDCRRIALNKIKTTIEELKGLEREVENA